MSERTIAVTPLGPAESGRTAVIERAMVRVLRGAIHWGRAISETVGLVDPAGFVVLRRVGEAAPVRPSDLAEMLGVDLSTVSRHLAKLDDKGFLIREADPEDGRAVLVVLTDDGRRVVEEVTRARVASLEGLLGEWTDDELALLATSLIRLGEAFDQTREES